MFFTIFYENALIFMTFPDFPGSARKYEIHPQKLCASRIQGVTVSELLRALCDVASGADAARAHRQRRARGAVRRHCHALAAVEVVAARVLLTQLKAREQSSSPSSYAISHALKMCS